MKSGPPPLRFVEFVGGIALILLALVPRLRDITGPFDREFEGAQGAIFSIAAINYERLGLTALDGYPVLNIDLPRERTPTGELRDKREAWYAYANHPPTVPWMAYLGYKLFALPEWNEQLGSRGSEYAPRIPFVLSQLAFLLAFWWALREADGPRVGLLGLLFACAAPSLSIYAPLVNYENPSLFAIALGFGFYARWLRTRSPRDRFGIGFAFALGASVTYAPLIFLGVLVVHAAIALGRRAVRELIGPLLAALVPLVVQAIASRVALSAIGQEPDGVINRVKTMLAPLFSGEHPISEWSKLQFERIEAWYTPLFVAVALAGVAVSVWRLKKPIDERVSPMPMLFAIGGALYLFAFYRHTLDPQNSFLMLVAPGICAFAAIAVSALEPIAKRVGGRLFFAVVAIAIAVPCVLRTMDLRRSFRSPLEPIASHAPFAPELPLPDELGGELRALIPEGSFAIVPNELGLNTAVAYYAWRTLWPTNGPDDTLPFAVAHFYSPGAPHLIVLPKDPPPSAKAACDLLRAKFASAPPVRSSAHFDAWPAP